MWNEHACFKVAWDFIRMTRFCHYAALSAPAVSNVARILMETPDVSDGRIGKDWATFPAVLLDIVVWVTCTYKLRAEQVERKVGTPTLGLEWGRGVGVRGSTGKAGCTCMGRKHR